MAHVAVLTPVVLLLLMVVLGRLEHWLEASTPPAPPRSHGHRWRRRPVRVRPGTWSEVGVGRSLLAHRTRAARRRATVPPRTPAAVPGSGRRQRLGTRLRLGR